MLMYWYFYFYRKDPIYCIKRICYILGTFLAVQWLRLRTPNAQGTGSIPGRGTKIPHATRCSQKTNKSNNNNKTVKCNILVMKS